VGVVGTETRQEPAAALAIVQDSSGVGRGAGVDALL
jgi:hypothetical protein